MEFFFYCRDRPGSELLRDALGEAHWSFMDRYADGMIARGPTLTEDGAAATGSVHIVDLPDAAAARTFAYDEPNYRAGVYRDVLVRRYRNLLGRTMWEFTGAGEGARQFLVLGHGEPGTADAAGSPPDDGRLIAYGPLLSADGTVWTGTAALVEASDHEAARAVLADDRYGRAGRYADIEVHHWTFGGRR